MNSTPVSRITLAAYYDLGLLRYFFFLLVLLLYLLILGANLLLIVAICGSRRLREPMYLFLVSLFANELFGSTGLFPFLLLQILSDAHAVSLPFCFLQVFCVYSYVCAEFSNLAVMAYDRYLAICLPLQYNTRMTLKKVGLLVAVTWTYAFAAIAVLIALTAPLRLCGGTIDKVYCVNYAIVKLACADTRVNNVYGLILTFLTAVCPVAVILYTYLKILQVCFHGSRRTRQKALGTCAPHLASLLNFSLGVCLEILQSRLEMISGDRAVQILASLYFLTCQLLFNPLMYGLNAVRVREVCRGLLTFSAVRK